MLRRVQTTGRLEIIRGCMFSGKTERLISRVREAQETGRRVVAFKHSIDDRYDATHLITHRHERFPAERAPNAAQIERRSSDYEVVGIDEGQFFGSVLVDSVRRLVGQGKRVIIAGIDHDAWGRPFKPMPELAAMADEDVLTVAPCMVCGQDARYSQRMAPVMTNTMVGGSGDYQPRCVRCFEPLPPPAPEQP